MRIGTYAGAGRLIHGVGRRDDLRTDLSGASLSLRLSRIIRPSGHSDLRLATICAVRGADDTMPQLMVHGGVSERSGASSRIQRGLLDLFSDADCQLTTHIGLPAFPAMGHVLLAQKDTTPSVEAFEITKARLNMCGSGFSRTAAFSYVEAIHGKVEPAMLVVRTAALASQAASGQFKAQ